MRGDTQEGEPQEGRKARREGGRTRKGKEGGRKTGRKGKKETAFSYLANSDSEGYCSWLVSDGGGGHGGWWSSSLSLTKHVPSEEGC